MKDRGAIVSIGCGILGRVRVRCGGPPDPRANLLSATGRPAAPAGEWTAAKAVYVRVPLAAGARTDPRALGATHGLADGHTYAVWGRRLRRRRPPASVQGYFPVGGLSVAKAAVQGPWLAGDARADNHAHGADHGRQNRGPDAVCGGRLRRHTPTATVAFQLPIRASERGSGFRKWLNGGARTDAYAQSADRCVTAHRRDSRWCSGSRGRLETALAQPTPRRCAPYRTIDRATRRS